MYTGLSMGPFDTLTQEDYSRFRSVNSLLIKPPQAFQNHINKLANRISKHAWKKHHNGVAIEFRTTDMKAHYILNFLFNDKKVLKTAQRLLDTKSPLSFEGRAFKLPSRHHFPWHTDSNEKSRKLAISVNLSTSPFKGGNFQQRQKGKRKILCDVQNSELGSILLFRIDSALEHRVLPILSRSGKVVYCGFFRELNGSRK
ncbi:MAG: 2OG-Fe(II) oxygenase [Bdellovibrionales bacterium]|nr:2OG-Fe(II) oxygenase [Bdellovibrionales bacterium]